MKSSRFLASILSLLVLSICSEPVHAQGTPAGRTKYVIEVVKPPEKAEKFAVQFRVHKDNGKTFYNPYGPPKKSKKYYIEIQLDPVIHNTPVKKAAAIDMAISEAVGTPDVPGEPEDHPDWGVQTGLFGPSFDPEDTRPAEIHLSNRQGFWIEYLGFGESTREKDRIKNVSPPNPGDLASIDISGEPAGGQVHIEVNGEHVQSLDTIEYFSPFELELGIAFWLSQDASITADISPELLIQDAELAFGPFDGNCVILSENLSDSFSVHVDDPGLVLSIELVPNPRADEVGSVYCDSTVNSTGQAAKIWARGSTNVSDNYLVLHAENVTGQYGVFFAGPNQINVPFGEGFRCVGGGVTRLNRPQQGSENQASVIVDLQPQHMGTTFNAQYWFRDPAGGGSNFNLSDAVNVVL